MRVSLGAGGASSGWGFAGRDRVPAGRRQAGASPGEIGCRRRGLVVVAVGETAEEALACADGGFPDAADHADERVRRPAPGLLVGAGRRLDLLADRRLRVVFAPRVVPGQDVAVLALRGPPVELGEADHRERVRVAL